MPLIKGKSPKAFSKNVETEMEAGKPKDQSLAIAYSMKKKAPKMAVGGEVLKQDHKDTEHAMSSPSPSDPEPHTTISPMEAKSIAEAIMHASHAKKMMASGGMVDLDTNAEEQPNGFYDLNEHEALDEDMDSTMDSVFTPEDSDEDSIKLDDEDKHDMVGKIMKKSKKSM